MVEPAHDTTRRDPAVAEKSHDAVTACQRGHETDVERAKLVPRDHSSCGARATTRDIDETRIVDACHVRERIGDRDYRVARVEGGLSRRSEIAEWRDMTGAPRVAGVDREQRNVGSRRRGLRDAVEDDASGEGRREIHGSLARRRDDDLGARRDERAGADDRFIPDVVDVIVVHDDARGAGARPVSVPNESNALPARGVFERACNREGGLAGAAKRRAADRDDANVRRIHERSGDRSCRDGAPDPRESERRLCPWHTAALERSSHPRADIDHADDATMRRDARRPTIVAA